MEMVFFGIAAFIIISIIFSSLASTDPHHKRKSRSTRRNSPSDGYVYSGDSSGSRDSSSGSNDSGCGGGDGGGGGGD